MANSPDSVLTDQPHAHTQVFVTLAGLSAVERTDLILRLIEEHPEARLMLPMTGHLRAVIDGINLAESALSSRGLDLTIAPWWDAERHGVRLRGADLRGACLNQANLQNADLAQSNLRQAQLRGADLQKTRFEEANLQSADLANTDMTNAVLGGADLARTMFEDANLTGASLRFVHGPGVVFETANLQGADLWGARLQDAVLVRANLQKAIFAEADLRGADLSGADLREAVLVQTDFRGAKFQGADLRGAIVTRANFEGADFKDAKLQGLVLLDCNLTHVHFTGAAIDNTQFQREQLGDAIGEELACQHEEARRAYLALERHFSQLGDADAVSWAYRRRRRMRKHAALEEARATRAGGNWRPARVGYARFVGDQCTEWLSDYGESAPRVLICMLCVYVFFLVLYAATNSVVRVT